MITTHLTMAKRVLMRGRRENILFMSPRLKAGLLLFAFVTLGWTSLCLGQTPPPSPAPDPGQHSPDHQGTASAGGQLPDPRLPDQHVSGGISGTVVDQSGAVVAGAQVTLTRTSQDPSSKQEA